MQIIGIGNDVIEVERIDKAIKNNAFLDRVYSKNELGELYKANKSSQSYAGLFAAKEAVVKALGCGFGKLSAKDISIEKDELGRPMVNILSNDYNNIKFQISVSHIKSIAMATALAYKED